MLADSSFVEMDLLPVKHTHTPSFGFLGGSAVKNPPVTARDTGSIPGLGRFHRPQSG